MTNVMSGDLAVKAAGWTSVKARQQAMGLCTTRSRRSKPTVRLSSRPT